MTTTSLNALCVATLFSAFSLAAAAPPASAPAAFDGLLAALREHPEQDALRGRIIDMALKMRPKPSVPTEAVKASGAAKYAVKLAKTPADFSKAVEQFKQAVAAAPWVADYYYNLGACQEKAGGTLDAAKSFDWYLRASPHAKDAEQVQERIGGLEYAAKAQAAAQAQAAAAQAQADQWLNKVNGARFTSQSGPWPGSSMSFTNTIDVQGRQLLFGAIPHYGSDVQSPDPNGVWVAKGKCALSGRTCDDVHGNHYEIAEDGSSIAVTYQDGRVTYARQ